jgi:hypothetical protein
VLLFGVSTGVPPVVVGEEHFSFFQFPLFDRIGTVPGLGQSNLVVKFDDAIGAFLPFESDMLNLSSTSSI